MTIQALISEFSNQSSFLSPADRERGTNECLADGQLLDPKRGGDDRVRVMLDGDVDQLGGHLLDINSIPSPAHTWRPEVFDITRIVSRHAGLSKEDKRNVRNNPR